MVEEILKNGEQMFTIKEILLRTETSMNAKMDSLRQDISHAQANMVSKGELDVHLRTINRDTERVERQLREEIKMTHEQLDQKLKEYREDSRNDLYAFKEDINTSITRLILILGFVIAVIQVLIAVI